MIVGQYGGAVATFDMYGGELNLADQLRVANRTNVTGKFRLYGGTVNVTMATLPGMLARGRGDLVNFASVAGWMPTLHFGAYNASKFAIVAFTEVLYHENRGKGVQITCVCPSQVDTPLVSQATSKPKILETGPAPMKPEKVLDAVDRAIDRGQFWVFPGVHTSAAWRLRRFLPSLMWKIDHRTEGF